jgi:hypothetical protein
MLKVLVVPPICVLFALCLFADSVEITDVRPSKIMYSSGEQGRASIVVRNSTASDVPGVLTVSDEWDVDESREVWEEEIGVPAGQDRVFDITWDAGDELYGHALRAVVMVDGKVVAERAEFFQVSVRDNWFRMFIINGGGRKDVAVRDKNPFATYYNFTNHFSYAEADFARLAPEPDVYYSGQARYRIDKKELIDSISFRHELGIRAGAYTVNVTGGPAGYELARQHPEWFLRDERGAFHACNRPVSPVDLAYPPDKRPKEWCLLAPDFGNPDVVQYGADEVVRAIAMFDWDAFFFDVAPYGMIHYNVNSSNQPNAVMYTWDGALWHRGKDPDSFSVETLRRVRRIIRESYPHQVLWYNGANPEHAFMRKQSYAALEDPLGGTLCELQGVQLINPTSPWHNWRSLFEFLMANRSIYFEDPRLDTTVLALGYLYNLSFDSRMSAEAFEASRDTWAMANHIGAFFIAGHFHPCLTSSSSWRPSTQFMTRYSSLLWAENVKLMANPWDTITVNSNREVWWEEAVYTRETDSFKDTIIHILNSPEQETIDPEVSEDPPPARYVEVAMKMGENHGDVRVWALSPYNYADTLRQPKQSRLTPHISGGKLVVELPPFVYHTAVVIRESKMVPGR